jgi:hypothetical protein
MAFRTVDIAVPQVLYTGLAEEFWEVLLSGSLRCRWEGNAGADTR